MLPGSNFGSNKVDAPRKFTNKNTEQHHDEFLFGSTSMYALFISNVISNGRHCIDANKLSSDMNLKAIKCGDIFAHGRRKPKYSVFSETSSFN